jgi:uncharacterized protein YbbK (DUF523 family)/uncharacterized protein YbgA (DUF1722 family)
VSPLKHTKVTHPVIRLGISACLLGEQVRWDGGHKLDPWLADQLGRLAQYYPVCPEVECGFGVPREPFRLVGNPPAARLVTSRTKHDYTERMIRWARRKVRELAKEDLYGFIFQGKSPSCGIGRVQVYGVSGKDARTTSGQGLFAKAFIDHFPLIPVEDAGRIQGPQIRANFIERCIVMKEWRDVLRWQRRNSGSLLRFHLSHTLLILSHSPWHHRLMDKLVAGATAGATAALSAEYQRLLLEALRLMATPVKHGNVLQHVMGYFKKQLSRDERQELQDAIDGYREGHVSLIVPIRRINHYARLFNNVELLGQRYLLPKTLQFQVLELPEQPDTCASLPFVTRSRRQGHRLCPKW